MNHHLSSSLSGDPDSFSLERAFQLLDEEVETGEIPGGVALVTHRGKVVGVHASGYSIDYGEDREQTVEDTLYDCASLTKVTVTLPLILQGLGLGLLRLDDPVTHFIPAFAANNKDHITVKQLLVHTSGLPAHQPFYLHGWTPEETINGICRLPLDYKTETKVIYSDLGYILLGQIASLVFGDSLDRVAEQRIFDPLGMKQSTFCPPESWRPLIAATEYTDQLGRCKRGEVHDENAYALGGVSGHAGLFSTARDLARYAQMWLAGGRTEDGQTILPQASVQAALRSHTGKLSAHRGLGWVLKGDKMDASGDLLSNTAYGHTGFTGVCLTMDPERELGVVLLTNRVHYGRDKSVARLRARFHNAVAASLP
ncbi:serine hydrolase [Paenibacillus sp. J2TS4]|uniref:serine hydrolase domain-containing protein n=1 Tax=Paenibacillus sp. J2TS4 TaxID=2807194 RepID=UPI001B06A474|nr:serine hydrolase domain-containing protein [Paenibacillus sp. J2TS4]GIP33158.1 serine hydrolase [Paenibacillus sp. J2TS4]